MGRVLKIILVLLLFYIPGQLMSQDSATVVLLSTMDEFTIIPTGENTYKIKADDNEYYYNNDANLPAIPIKNISILVPNGAEIINYDITIQKAVIKSDIKLDCSYAISPILPLVQGNKSEFVFQGLYPEKPIQYTSVSVQRGFTKFNFSFSPFVYSGSELSLEFISHLTLKVKYKINKSKISTIHADDNLKHVIKQSVANPKAMERLYDNNKVLKTESVTEKVDYLIVTNNNLEDSFKPLIQWKNRKGLHAKIITVEDIYQKYDQPTRQLEIKKCLLDFYENNDLKWVLLAGDTGIVPVQYCYNFLEEDTNDLNSIPTDLFYACFDSRFDWNSYEDDKIGELFFDGHDLIPEVYLTRLPVNTIKEAEAIVGKTLEYEMNPVSSTLGKTIFAGVKLWNTWNGKSDSHYRSELIYKKYIQGNILGDNFYFLDTGTDFNEGADYDVTSVNLKEKLDNGFGLLHFTGHGSQQSLNMESGVSFGTNDVLNLTNKVGGLVLTNACYTNAFDRVDPCLSEALIRNPNGGCVAYFGSSRSGFGNQIASSELGVSLKYNAKFIDYIFNEKRSNSLTFGEIAAFTKNQFSVYGPSSPYYSYVLYAINPIGDPELPLYRGIPQTFQNVRIFELNNILYINTGGVENSRICVTSLDMNDGYKKSVENVSSHSFGSLPEQYQLTITAPNYKPYTYVSGNLTALSSNISASINVFPNPASEYLHVDFSLPKGLLQIYDVNGKLLKEQFLSSGSNEINILDLPEGVLILNFKVNQGNAKYKIVKCNY